MLFPVGRSQWRSHSAFSVACGFPVAFSVAYSQWLPSGMLPLPVAQRPVAQRRNAENTYFQSIFAVLLPSGMFAVALPQCILSGMWLPSGMFTVACSQWLPSGVFTVAFPVAAPTPAVLARSSRRSLRVLCCSWASSA